MITVLIRDTTVLGFLIWLIWPSVQNFISTTRGGTGPRHRESGPATPWRRRRRIELPRLRDRRAPLVRTNTYVDPAGEWIKLVNQSSPAGQIRAIDLSALRRAAGGPL